MNKEDPASAWNFDTTATICPVRPNRLNNKEHDWEQTEVLYIVKLI